MTAGSDQAPKSPRLGDGSSLSVAQTAEMCGFLTGCPSCRSGKGLFKDGLGEGQRHSASCRGRALVWRCHLGGADVGLIALLSACPLGGYSAAAARGALNTVLWPLRIPSTS